MGIIHSEIRMKIQYKKFYKKKKICRVSVRTIRLSSNYIYFVYYYTNICDLTFIGIFFSKT